MSVLEKFASLAMEAGIPVDAAMLPSPETVKSAIEAMDAWFWDLPPEIREGFDEGSSEYKVAYLLADPEVGVGSDVPSLLDAFDNSSGISFSEALSTSRTLLQQAMEGVG